jgi:mannose-6-phosphate isomerase-like protein (cupin superfamily)
MRAVIISLALMLVSHSVLAQQPAAPGPGQVMKTLASSADVAALVAKAKSERKEGQANAAVHEREAELFYVIDGSATIVTGGKLADEKRTNAENLSGTGITGGTPRRVAKGDFIMVPENTPHWFSTIDGSITLMSLHLPRAGNTTR